MGIKDDNLVVSIHQPGYHRYLGFYKKILESDAFIILDTVQYVPREWQNRQRFIHSGKEKWLSVPVNKGRNLIKDEIIIGDEWRTSHFNTIKEIYRKAKFWNEHESFLNTFYRKDHKSLEKMCTEMMMYALNALDIKTKIYLASDFESQEAYKTHKGELLSSLIRDLVNLNPEYQNRVVTYLSGEGALEYINSIDDKGNTQLSYFEKLNYDIKYSAFHPEVYNQISNKEAFTPYLSVFDALLNIGSKQTKLLLK